MNRFIRTKLVQVRFKTVIHDNRSASPTFEFESNKGLPINSSVKYRLSMLIDAKQIAHNVFINKGFMEGTAVF